ncbi:hypothetical protein GUITHDRAFT_104761 [Guillardia theta CCMP2712]|uniref:Uncharacterized protein n=1 Tax=Guillardia theta (strain CCMP2712) TaxID=905079 RepID=L1JLK2_GUITC|nr:hypothetical protein GUITHDRAFT_104761 [Guillardia theta CCMP2712]EKX49232.1 hypothetical protein GUITHDRAFT_104761 [Guillardia theta CCMP2712]|eukprot:XP_005836212.1 hypothetical protein GUITHDRAFT_104761 [Guillardia theta CCMP2712]
MEGIEDQWQSLTTKEPRLWWYDGTLFRLASAQRWKDIDGSQEVKLECGVTRYRSFLGTNMSPNWAKIPEVHMSDPLSCFVLVHSSDDQVMFVQRKDPILGSRQKPCCHGIVLFATAALPLVHFAMSKKHFLCILSLYSIFAEMNSNSGSEKWKPSMRNGVESPRPYSKVITELFSCPLREANGDLGLKSNDFFELPLMLGIAKSSRNRTIAAVFYLATHLTAEEIKEKHSQSALPHSCRCISISDKDALPTLDLDLQPCCRAALYLFAQYLRTHRGAHVRNGGGITDLKQDGEEMTSFPSKGTYLREAEGRGRSMQKNQFAVFSNKSEDPGEAVVEEGSLSVADVRSLSPRHLDAVKYSNLQYKYGFQDDSEIEKVFQEKKGKWQRSPYDDDDDDDDYAFLPRQSSMMAQEFKGNFNRSELVEALYWWLSVYQDPVVIERALVQLKLHSLVSQGEQLSTEQMVAVLERQRERQLLTEMRLKRRLKNKQKELERKEQQKIDKKERDRRRRQ